ncbi:hypothetical protein P280DRAFT_238215 [Massarina eburnea CBS 473.64]|uniref:Uncharacterized protein n=1 Tax=Massarina eburnea CBS 473.64 TaxID=1395130 RepID=A0A6A6RHS7_9PLEO|nr:hypothetical protein P280DRAFT_238215 [Massarina eburnea CBS 473.64]
MHFHFRHRRTQDDVEVYLPRLIPKRIPKLQPQEWWGDGAAYAPGFPLDGQDERRGFVARPAHLPPLPQQVRVPHPPPDIPIGRRPRVVVVPKGARKVKVEHRVHVGPQRHVHFDVPSRNGEEEKHGLRHRENGRRPTTPAQYLRPRSSRPDVRNPHPAYISRKACFHEERRHSQPNLHPSPSQHHLPRSDRPTIHIITYALKHTPHTRDALHILSDNLPPNAPHLYTIHAYKFTPPPERLCAEYSGVSGIIQEHVMRDERARKAVRRAVDDVVEWGKQEMERVRQGEREGRRVEGRRDVAISVCCVYGTHRSVGVAERIGREIREVGRWEAGGREVRVRLVHVHRVRGVKDAY